MLSSRSLWRCVVGAGHANGVGFLGLLLHVKFTPDGEFFACAGVTDLGDVIL